MFRRSIAIALTVSLAIAAGCAGKTDYVRPDAGRTAVTNSKVIERPKDAVWNAAIPQLGKQFFVINNLDKDSGLVNISYSGDPERYVDCGRITSQVKNLRGDRTYDFPAAKAQQMYETLDNTGLYSIDRRMSLDGRVNLIFEEVGPSSTRVTANTKYVLQRQQTIQAAANNATRTFEDSVSFNTGGSGNLGPTERSIECSATGALEQEVLDAIQ